MINDTAYSLTPCQALLVTSFCRQN